jgi:limonene-1,2-epoxide hydrolase
MSDNEKVIEAFVAAWSNLDAAELAGYFTEDGTYHNMMLDPVTGRENLTAFINGFISNWSETNWEMVNIVSNGDLVVAERVDRTRIGDKRVDLPCVGMFEMEGGKIKVWRDYFDLATYSSAFAE